MTLMVACCRATSSFATESVRTLQFAMGVKHIRNKPVLVLDAHEKLVHDLRAEIRELKKENGLLRGSGVDGGARLPLVAGAAGSHGSQGFSNLSEQASFMLSDEALVGGEGQGSALELVPPTDLNPNPAAYSPADKLNRDKKREERRQRKLERARRRTARNLAREREEAKQQQQEQQQQQQHGPVNEEDAVQRLLKIQEIKRAAARNRRRRAAEEKAGADALLKAGVYVPGDTSPGGGDALELLGKGVGSAKESPGRGVGSDTKKKKSKRAAYGAPGPAGTELFKAAFSTEAKDAKRKEMQKMLALEEQGEQKKPGQGGGDLGSIQVNAALIGNSTARVDGNEEGMEKWGAPRRTKKTKKRKAKRNGRRANAGQIRTFSAPNTREAAAGVYSAAAYEIPGTGGSMSGAAIAGRQREKERSRAEKVARAQRTLTEVLVSTF